MYTEIWNYLFETDLTDLGLKIRNTSFSLIREIRNYIVFFGKIHFKNFKQSSHQFFQFYHKLPERLI